MPKKPDPPEPPGVPTWFLTYSDVITLLMTFFILLLTFATNEPEKFERMQISLFGGSGGMGVAGPTPLGMDKDAVLIRERPRSGRLTMRGSEIPSVHSDPNLATVGKGLKSLDQKPESVMEQIHSLRLTPSLLVGDDGETTPVGRKFLGMIAKQLRQLPFEITFEVPDQNSISQGVTLAQHLGQNERILPGRIAVAVPMIRDPSNPKITIRMRLQEKD